MKVVVTEFVSLDGVMEDPGGAEAYEHGGWTFRINQGEEGYKFKMEELFDAEALLLGRVTYQAFAKAWPTVKDGGDFAERMNSIKKYVVSSTLKEPDATWGDTTIIRGDVPAEVGKLKAQPGGNLLVEGSAQLVHTLIEHGLVDDYRLTMFPILLGSGKRLYPDMSKAATLKLIDSKTVGDGVILLTYAPGKES
jgi:dihydrofolate reductase